MYLNPERYTERVVIRGITDPPATGNIIVDGDALTFLQTYLADDFSNRYLSIDDMNPAPNVEITVKYGERSFTILCDESLSDTTL